MTRSTAETIELRGGLKGGVVLLLAFTSSALRAQQEGNVLGPPAPPFAIEIAPLFAINYSAASQVIGDWTGDFRVKNGLGLGLGTRVGFRFGESLVLDAAFLRVTSDRVVQQGRFDYESAKVRYQTISSSQAHHDYTWLSIGQRYGRLDRAHFVWFAGPMLVNFRGEAYPAGDTSSFRLKRREQRGLIFGMRIQKELTQDLVSQFGFADAVYRTPVATSRADVPMQQDLQFTATLAWRMW